MFMILCTKTNNYSTKNLRVYVSILQMKKHQSLQSKNDPIHHVWMSLLFSILLSITRCFTFLASEQPPWMNNSQTHLLNVYRGSHSEKRSVSVYMFPNMPLKKIRHCNTEYQLPEDLQISSRKVQDSWKMEKPMKVVMWFTKWKKEHKWDMKRHLGVVAWGLWWWICKRVTWLLIPLSLYLAISLGL